MRRFQVNYSEALVEGTGVRCPFVTCGALSENPDPSRCVAEHVRSPVAF